MSVEENCGAEQEVLGSIPFPPTHVRRGAVPPAVAESEGGAGSGWPGSGRDSSESAGKFALRLKLLSLGVNESRLFVDSAQRGDIDAFLSGPRVEIKCARAKMRRGRAPRQDASPQFQICGLRDTRWRKLLLMCRERDPADWSSAADLDACGLWLGAIARDRFEAARTAAGRGALWDEEAVVSPCTDGVRHGGWLSPHVAWVRFEDLTREWCEEHVL
jgi:hypothetical protein